MEKGTLSSGGHRVHRAGKSSTVQWERCTGNVTERGGRSNAARQKCCVQSGVDSVVLPRAVWPTEPTTPTPPPGSAQISGQRKGDMWTDG